MENVGLRRNIVTIYLEPTLKAREGDRHSINRKTIVNNRLFLIINNQENLKILVLSKD